MKYNKKRKISTLFGLIPLLVLLFGIVGGVTYAIVAGTQAQSQHGFKVNVRGAVNVSATIKGSSSVNNVPTTDDVQVIVSGENVSVVEGKEASFNSALNFDQVGDRAELIFEVSNTTEATEYTDLLVAPSYSLSYDDTIDSEIYYSLDNTDYEVLNQDYLVVHKDEKIYVKVIIEVTEIRNTVLISGNVYFNLYSEDGMPADFEYNTGYSMKDGIAYEAVLCPTCGEILSESQTALEDQSGFLPMASFTLNSDGNGYTVTVSEDKTIQKAIIPEYIEGKPVTAIGENAFKNCSEMTYVYIPATIETIGEYSFNYCSRLADIDFAENGDLKTIGYYSFSSCNSLTDLVIPNSVETIEDFAFYTCNSLKNITIPESVTTIKSHAFHECPSVENIYYNASVPIDAYPDSTAAIFNYPENETYNMNTTVHVNAEVVPNYMFYATRNVKKVVFGDNVKVVGERAFQASYVETIEQTENSHIESIGKDAFNTCRYLTTVEFNGDVDSIGMYAFMDCTKLETFKWPETLKNIDSHAFRGCTSLIRVDVDSTDFWFDINFGSTDANPLYASKEEYLAGRATEMGYVYVDGAEWKNVTVPASVKALKPYVFTNHDLTSVIFEDGSVCTSIGAYAFTQNKNLASFDFPDSLKTIGHRAFQWCESTTFTEINIPANVARIDGCAFDGCNHVTVVTVDAANTYFTSPEGSNCIITLKDVSYNDGFENISRKANTLIFGCQTTVIPDSVDHIAARAFYAQTEMTSMTIPEGVLTIGSEAFRKSGLTSIVIPDSVTTIGDEAFGKTMIASAEFGSGIKEIGNIAFDGCPLTSVSFEVTEGWTSNGVTVDLSDSSVAIEKLKTSKLIRG